MSVIITIIGIMFLILIAWAWSSLGKIEEKKKLLIVIIGIAIVYELTFIIFNISKIGIEYSNDNAMKIIRRVYVILFSIVNGYILLPYIFKRLNKINNDDMKKVEFKNTLLIILIVIVILFILESIYFGNVQQKIVEKYNTKIQTELNGTSIN